MATAFNDSIRNQIEQERVRNERAIAGMQLLASMNQTGATRYGHDKSLEAARLSAANEAERIRNALTLGREHYGTQERIAGAGNASTERVAGLGHTSSETIARLERESRKDIAIMNSEIAKLPFSPAILAHELEKARLGMRLDPYVERDIGRYNLESESFNREVDDIANSANEAITQLKLERDASLANTTVSDRFTWDSTINKRYADAVKALDTQLGVNRQSLSFDPVRQSYTGRKRPIIPIPRRNNGITPGAVPSVPGIPNQSLLAPPAYGTPPSLQMSMPGLPQAPTGGVAVPAIPRQSGGASGSWNAPMSVPAAAPAVVRSAVPSGGLMAPRQLPFWAQPNIPQPYVDPNPPMVDPRIRTQLLEDEMFRLTGRRP